MLNLGKQIQTSLRLISVSLSNVLYCIYDVSVVSRCTLYLNKILFTLNSHALNALTYQADCACWRRHNLDKSNFSISILWLLNVHS